MGLRDIAFGRKNLPGPRDDRLFALSTASVTLETELGLTSGGKAAITYRPLSSGEFSRVDDDAAALVNSVGSSLSSSIERKSDSFGFEWLIISDPELEGQVTSVHAVAAELTAQGFGEQLLAAPFRFEGAQRPVYLIYGFKRGAFWPFIPNGQGQNRDNAAELELKAKLEDELPIEQDLTRWLGLFDAPI